jgi:hypothetical protein
VIPTLRAVLISETDEVMSSESRKGITIGAKGSTLRHPDPSPQTLDRVEEHQHVGPGVDDGRLDARAEDCRWSFT